MAEVRIAVKDWVRIDGDGMTLRISETANMVGVARRLDKSGDPDMIDVGAAIHEALDEYMEEQNADLER